MRTHATRSIAIAVGALLVLTAAAGLTSTSTAAVSPGDEHPVCAAYDRGVLSKVTVAELLSRDVDSGEINETKEVYRDRCGHDYSDDLLLLTAFDQTWSTPTVTEQATQWTESEFTRNWNTKDDRSVVPEGARTTRNQYLRDVHTTVFALEPATRLHRDSTTTQAFIAPEGTLRAVTDYRDGEDTEIDNGRKYVSRNVYRSSVELTCLIDGNVSDLHGSGTNPCERDSVLDRNTGHQATLEYDLRDQVGTDRTLSVVSVIEYGANRHVRECTDWNETREFCTGDYERSSERDAGRITAVDTRDVTVYDEPTVDVQIIEYPNGENTLLVESDEPIAGLRIGDETLQWQWRYYTATNGDWVTVTDYGPDGTTERPAKTRPLQVSAYPSTTGLDPPGDARLSIRETGVERSSPNGTIPDTVGVDVVQRPYETPTEIALEGLSIDSSDEITVIGLVDGINTTLDSDDIGERKTVRETTLETTIITQNSSHATIRLQLFDSLGQPVDLRDRPGSVRIRGQRVETDASGTATVTIRRLGIVTARYEPGDWVAVDQPYTTSQATIQFQPTDDLVALLWTMVVALTVLLAPIWVLLYAIDGLGGATTWPPWEVLRFR